MKREFKVVLSEDAKGDYYTLPIDVWVNCNTMLDKLRSSRKRLGIELEDKDGMDLRGLYKLYFNKTGYRIVYKVKKVLAEPTRVRETLEITAIGARKNVYKKAYDRIKKKDLGVPR